MTRVPSPFPGGGAQTLRAASFVAALLAAGLLSGCGMLHSREQKPDAPLARVLPPPAPPTDGAIYQAGQQMELFADLKARRVGDILTIKLNESINASKNAVTKTNKATTVDTTGPTIFGRAITTGGVPILNTSLKGGDTFDGEGSSTQSNSLVGAITVTVIGVQANGNLIVQGDKTLKLNQGDEFVRISGVIRPADIAADNTVTSDRVADARISYSGKGAVASSNHMGWLARFFNSPFMPF